MKIKRRPQILVRRSFLELRHSKLPDLCTFNNIVILLGQKLG